MSTAATSLNCVTARVPAKVNLELMVGPLRPDGFHHLATVFQAVGLHDDVTVEPAEEWGISINGPYADLVPADETNLALRAARMLAGEAGMDLPVQITIDKDIPVAAGMAGGSADAAGAILACDALWGLSLSKAAMEALAAELGSDVPFALIGGSAHGLGHGEEVTPLSDRGSYWWVVVPSDEGLSTPDVYREFDRLHPDLAANAHGADPAAVISALEEGDPDGLAASMRNDLEEAALALRPSLVERMVLVQEHCTDTVMLSGSGPTILGIARTQEEAIDSRAALLEVGLPVVHVATGPVAGAHVVEYA
jgi:4-diphosphocytidyl-2-C-methyl-D-erythritol kinase